MLKICENCNKEYEAKRDTSKYCSEKCKKAFQRISGTNSFSVTAKNGVSGTKGVKMAEKVSGTKNEVVESIDKSHILSRAGDPKFNVLASYDDKYSLNYDLSEEGYIRRNKNWLDFSERFRENIRKDAIQIKKDIQVELAMLQRMRECGWVNPLVNTKLAPKG